MLKEIVWEQMDEVSSTAVCTVIISIFLWVKNVLRNLAWHVWWKPKDFGC